MIKIIQLILSMATLLLLSACNQEPQKQDGESIYNRSCISCHERGHGGAPLRGNLEQWQSRLDKGDQVLLENMVNGFNGMPPKGGCFDCTDEDLILALEYMLNNKNQKE